MILSDRLWGAGVGISLPALPLEVKGSLGRLGLAKEESKGGDATCRQLVLSLVAPAVCG